MSVIFNQICINEEMLPIYIYIYIYIVVRLQSLIKIQKFGHVFHMGLWKSASAIIYVFIFSLLINRERNKF